MYLRKRMFTKCFSRLSGLHVKQKTKKKQSFFITVLNFQWWFESHHLRQEKINFKNTFFTDPLSNTGGPKYTKISRKQNNVLRFHPIVSQVQLFIFFNVLTPAISIFFFSAYTNFLPRMLSVHSAYICRKVGFCLQF